MATASDLQQLYIGYFGRAADQEGLNFWLDAINNGGLSLANVHASFVQSAEYTAKYTGLTNEALVAQVYLNVLGRPADAEGKSFWANAITTGLITEDQLIEGLLSGLSASDKAIIDNKVTVANYYTAQRGADFSADDIATSGNILISVNGTTASVSTALNTIATTVPAANAGSEQVVGVLNSYLAAVKAEDDFAKTVINPATTKPVVDANGNGAFDEASAAATAAKAIAFGAAAAKVTAAAPTIALNPADAASVTQAKILEAIQQAAASVTSAQAAVDAKAGLNAAAKTFENAKAAYDAALKAKTAAVTELAAENAKFAVIDSTAAGGAYDPTTGVLTGVTKIVSGQLVLDPAYASPAKTAAQIEAANALLADIKADLAAFKAEADANTAVDSAATQLTSIDATTGYNPTTNVLTAGLVYTLQQEKTQQSELSKAATDLASASAVDKQLTDLAAAKLNADNAVDAILNGGLVSVANGAAFAATGSKELFVVDAAKLAIGSTASLVFESGDFLYVGAGYVKGTDTDAVTNGIQGGNNSALEVFFATSGANTVVTIEKTVFGSSAGTAEVVEVTLTGITADKVAFDASNGLITVA